MTGTITITVDQATVTAITPYDPGFPAAAKKIGGRWDTNKKAWTFDPRDEERVRTIVREIYGTDGSDDDQPGVTVRIPVRDRDVDQEFRVAGRRLAWRPGRDQSVRLADGVIVVAGGFRSSGGSMRNPDVAPKDGTVVEVRDLPAAVADRILAEIEGSAIVGDTDQRRAALTAERAQLVARLAEIDAILAEVTA